MKPLTKYGYPVVIDEWLKDETRKLDNFLQVVILHSYNMPDITFAALYEELEAENKIENSTELSLALEKLGSDKMIKVTPMLMPDKWLPQDLVKEPKYLNHYMVTFEGKVKALSGGYIGQIERDNKDEEQIESIRLSQKRLTTGALIVAIVAATISLSNVIIMNWPKKQSDTKVLLQLSTDSILKEIPKQQHILNNNLLKMDSTLRNLEGTLHKFH